MATLVNAASNKHELLIVSFNLLDTIARVIGNISVKLVLVNDFSKFICSIVA